MRQYNFLLFLVAATFVFLARDARAEKSVSSMLAFQLGGVSAIQDQGTSMSGQFSWNPNFSLTQDFGIRGNLGASLLNSQMDAKFFALNGTVYLTYSVFSFLSLEAGAGYEDWLNNGGGGLTYGGNAAFPFGGSTLLGIINRLYVGYSRFNLPNATTSEIHAGIGFVL